MKAYKPIGYYNDFEDIIDLYPSGPIKGDEADIISKYMLDGYGAFHTIDRPDMDAYVPVNDAKEDPCMVVSNDGSYAVRFSLGSMKLLKRAESEDTHDIDHGFFIDLYTLVDDPELDDINF